jgi:aspergillopepsin I
MKETFFTVDIKQGEDGVYNFGYIDDNRFSTQLTYMPVINWNQWIVQVSGYQVGSNGTKRDADRKALIGKETISGPRY